MTAAFALPLVLLAATPFQSSIKPLPPPVKAQLKQGGFWHKGCPVGLHDLRLLTVSHRGFDKRTHTGRLVVNKRAARPLRRVFHRLYRLHFPIRHMQLDVYSRKRLRDPTGAFECRKAVPSPCNPGRATGWSNHAYGLAVDINPLENPYVGCGASYHRAGAKYRDRSRHRPGMVTPRVVKAFRSIGWGWGGNWSGNTKDWMHFSVNGR